MGSLSDVAGAGLGAGWPLAFAALPVLAFFANCSVLCFREPSFSSLRLALEGLTRLLLSSPAIAAGTFLGAFSLPCFEPAARGTFSCLNM